MAKASAFACTWCDRRFTGLVHAVIRRFEQTHYHAGRPASVAVTGAEIIATSCTPDCRAAALPYVMAAQDVPIPSVRPGSGPIEACAKCGGPVDVSSWHLAFVEEDLRGGDGITLQPLDERYVAVVCPHCAPCGEAAAEAEAENAVTA